ncbi:MAG: hypothetical protein DDT42_01997 [candidate division WS2 bacterium]|uniref:Uncharacterized protein n=1 Tax=Psychracetigena formicireducens TaxID=2986056 RepID=A0A9E2BIE6_PSYF1|nr:hypothetical protein [Candidatus Psychracetigena formicireducens]
MSSNNQENHLLMMKVVCNQATLLEKEHLFIKLLKEAKLRKSYWQLYQTNRLLSENKKVIWRKENNRYSHFSSEPDLDLSLVLEYSKTQNQLTKAIHLNK